jgi:putative YphP/YqiW family bacilliredoxin
MYPPELVQPMREELTQLGAEELMTPEAVDAWVGDRVHSGLLVVNSVCGCAAGMARPGVGIAMRHGKRPQRLATVFAGQDRDATTRARHHFGQIPPSSPSMALFKNGQVVDFLPRHKIEGRTAQDVARDLTAMFEKHFGDA